MVVINLKGDNYTSRTYRTTFTAGENSAVFDVTINHDEIFDLVIDPASLPHGIVADSSDNSNRARVKIKCYGKCNNN